MVRLGLIIKEVKDMPVMIVVSFDTNDWQMWELRITRRLILFEWGWLTLEFALGLD